MRQKSGLLIGWGSFTRWIFLLPQQVPSLDAIQTFLYRPRLLSRLTFCPFPKKKKSRLTFFNSNAFSLLCRRDRGLRLNMPHAISHFQHKSRQMVPITLTTRSRKDDLLLELPEHTGGTPNSISYMHPTSSCSIPISSSSIQAMRIKGMIEGSKHLHIRLKGRKELWVSK